MEKTANEKLRNLYTPPNRIRDMKTRRVRWAGHVRIRNEKREKIFWLQNLKETHDSEHLGVGGGG